MGHSIGPSGFPPQAGAGACAEDRSHAQAIEELVRQALIANDNLAPISCARSRLNCES
jgi:hypothetical protein